MNPFKGHRLLIYWKYRNMARRSFKYSIGYWNYLHHTNNSMFNWSLVHWYCRYLKRKYWHGRFFNTPMDHLNYRHCELIFWYHRYFMKHWVLNWPLVLILPPLPIKLLVWRDKSLNRSSIYRKFTQALQQTFCGFNLFFTPSKVCCLHRPWEISDLVKCL